ncbi:PAS domain-containing sensor histidine kinase [Rhodohalobacter barkolensis]|uniref:histidine kinase n=1 Tax=Rhodohalobacter barkolensis TaxID=2053187 RepID=A0A2N0VIR8_9BACT|nr:PAS domain-containing sensor histidine kinase [Rhodohalobacter barkolensis]PKD44086.1 PAS domain-containing sensor histidine kinase [Rhodohalobacter barkolensis]
MKAISKQSDKTYNLELFFEISADLLCIAGFDGYFKKVNPSLIKLLGYSENELLSKPINEFIYPEDREITSNYRGRIRSGTPLLNFENRYVTKKGETVWLSWTSMPVKDLNLVYAVAKNITHGKLLAEHRNLQLSKLTKSNSDLKQLTYSTSHDLRAPLGNLISILSILDISQGVDEEILNLLGLLKTSAEKMRVTLDKQIDTIKYSENITGNVEEIDISECLSTVTQSIQSLIKDTETNIETRLEEFGSILYNRSYLESIFLNLITNSIKYAKPNTSPQILIQTKKEDQYRQIIFSDNGIGFEMDKVKDKIFGFNQTFHKNKDSEGIGLYLVYNHIRAMGGTIQVESEVNEGTTFTITLTN